MSVTAPVPRAGDSNLWLIVVLTARRCRCYLRNR